MRIILHAGAHCTDDDRLLTTLIRNKEILTKAKVAVPHPESYGILLRGMLNQTLKKELVSETDKPFVETILKGAPTNSETIILSNAVFFGFPTEILRSGQLYPNAITLLEKFLQLFPGDDVHLYFSIRNPASFLPAVFEASGLAEFSEVLAGTNPLEVQWSELFNRIRHAFPQLPVTLWCNEDSPFIWGQILRQMTQLPMAQMLSGDFDVFSEIVTKSGFERFKSYIGSHPTLTLRQLGIVMGAFAEKFGRREIILEEVEAPGWDQTLIQDLTDLYYEDLKSLPQIPNVNLILP